MIYKKLFLSFLIPILIFGCIELVLRAFNIEVNTGGDLRCKRFFNFRVIKSKKQCIDRDSNIETGPKIYSINSGSYRCRYYNYDKQPDEYRIITLGDSCTYGLGLDNSYPYYLENFLNSFSDKFKFKVFNFGFPGYSSFQGLQFLKQYINLLKPDCIIAWFGANDGCFAPFYSDKEFYLRNRHSHNIVKIHNFLYTNSKLYQILRNVNFNYFQTLVDRSFNNPIKKSYRKVRVSSIEFLENLEEIKKISNLNKSCVLFIWHCWFINGNLAQHIDYQPIEPYIDLYNIYRCELDEVSKYFVDHCHPSNLGNQVIAKKLAEEILKIISSIK